MDAGISDNRLSFAGWIAVVLTIPAFSLFGSQAQEYLEGIIGSSGIGVMFGTVIGLALVTAAVWIVLHTSNRGLIYLIWIGLIASAIMYHVAGNPERWYHLPLFGTAGFLTVQVYDLRTAAEIAAAMAFFDEFLQFYLSFRTGSVEDVFINAVSAGLGIVIWVLVQPGDKNRPLSVRND